VCGVPMAFSTLPASTREKEREKGLLKGEHDISGIEGGRKRGRSGSSLRFSSFRSSCYRGGEEGSRRREGKKEGRKKPQSQRPGLSLLTFRQLISRAGSAGKLREEGGRGRKGEDTSWQTFCPDHEDEGTGQKTGSFEEKKKREKKGWCKWLALLSLSSPHRRGKAGRGGGKSRELVIFICPPGFDSQEKKKCCPSNKGKKKGKEKKTQRKLRKTNGGFPQWPEGGGREKRGGSATVMLIVSLAIIISRNLDKKG